MTHSHILGWRTCPKDAELWLQHWPNTTSSLGGSQPKLSAPFSTKAGSVLAGLSTRLWICPHGWDLGTNLLSWCVREISVMSSGNKGGLFPAEKDAPGTFGSSTRGPAVTDPVGKPHGGHCGGDLHPTAAMLWDGRAAAGWWDSRTPSRGAHVLASLICKEHLCWALAVRITGQILCLLARFTPKTAGAAVGLCQRSPRPPQIQRRGCGGSAPHSSHTAAVSAGDSLSRRAALHPIQSRGSQFFDFFSITVIIFYPWMLATCPCRTVARPAPSHFPVCLTF